MRSESHQSYSKRNKFECVCIFQKTHAGENGRNNMHVISRNMCARQLHRSSFCSNSAAPVFGVKRNLCDIHFETTYTVIRPLAECVSSGIELITNKHINRRSREHILIRLICVFRYGMWIYKWLDGRIVISNTRGKHVSHSHTLTHRLPIERPNATMEQQNLWSRCRDSISFFWQHTKNCEVENEQQKTTTTKTQFLVAPLLTRFCLWFHSLLSTVMWTAYSSTLLLAVTKF